MTSPVYFRIADGFLALGALFRCLVSGICLACSASKDNCDEIIAYTNRLLEKR